MVNIQLFVTTVQNLTGDATNNDLILFCRKWFEENNDKLSLADTDRLLNHLLSTSTTTLYTLAVVYVLISKLLKVKTEGELKEFLNGLNNILPNFDVQQLHWAPDMYVHLFELVTDVLIKTKIPICGINLLKTSILVFTQGNPNWLTNIHPLLFCLCLKARYFDNIEPFLEIDVTQLLKQSCSAESFQTVDQQQQQNVTSTDNVTTTAINNSTSQQQTSPQNSNNSLASSAVSFIQKAVNTVSGTFGNAKIDETPNNNNKPILQTFVLFNRRSILLYFYYGALIFAALEKWEESVLFLEHLICLPSKRCSAIILEGFKKFIIISLIIGRKKPLEFLPTYRTPCLNRNYFSNASIYLRLPVIIEKAVEKKQDVVSVLKEYLTEKNGNFSTDQNVGLMKVLINTTRENELKRLENIFVSLHLNDVCRLANLQTNNNNEGNTDSNMGEQMILNLRAKNKICAQIDDSTKTVIFEEKQNKNGEEEGEGEEEKNKINNEENEINKAMNEIIKLSNIIRSYNNVIRLNPNFIEKNMQRLRERTNVNFGGGNCSTSLGGNDGGGGGGNLGELLFNIYNEEEGEGFYNPIIGGGGSSSH